jgi:hypothetical protein
LQNEGWFPTTLSTVAVTAPWLHLTSVTIDSLNTHGERGPGNVITLKPGDTVSYTLEFTVPNCTEIDKSGASVAVTAQGPLWTRTVNVRPPGTSDAGALSNQGWTVNPPELSWPVEAADLACKPVTAK